MRANLPGINRATKRLADGTIRTYYYHRATGKKLPDDPRSPEFFAAYVEAQGKRTAYDANTVGSLIRAYEESPDYLKLAESTRAIATYLFRAIDREYGTLPVSALKERGKVRADFLSWRDRLAKEHPRGADNTLAHLARVLSWAEYRGMIEDNPLQGWKRVYRSDRSERIWLPEHVKAFMKVAPVELQRAMTLALHTGQRQGDLFRLTWNAYDGKSLKLRQGKGKVRVAVPCTKALVALLDGLPRNAALILTTEDGEQWTRRPFNRKWNAALKEAGLEDLHFHDLRGTAITMLSEAGCTPQEIASITGHTLRNVSAILDQYLARTKTLAENAIAKLETRFALGS